MYSAQLGFLKWRVKNEEGERKKGYNRKRTSRKWGCFLFNLAPPDVCIIYNIYDILLSKR